MKALPSPQLPPCPRCGGLRLQPDERRAIVQDLMTALAEVSSLSPSRGARDGASEIFDATPTDIAKRYGVSADWVRDNAVALGGVRVGNGTKPRHRFNVSVTAARIAAMRSGEQPVAQTQLSPQRKRRAERAHSDVPLLPIKGRKPT